MTTFNRGSRWRPDGPVRYRTDSTAGVRIGILPATCKRGLHSLTDSRYQATVVDDLLRVACVACEEQHDPDYCWTLTLSDPHLRVPSLTTGRTRTSSQSSIKARPGQASRSATDPPPPAPPHHTR